MSAEMLPGDLLKRKAIVYVRQGRELLRALEPLAIEAALHAEDRYMEQENEQRRIVELELQARYEASLAERRYAACDLDNRLIASTREELGSHFTARARL